MLTARLLETNERNERLIEGLQLLSESDRGLTSWSPLRLDRLTEAVLDAHRSGPRQPAGEVTFPLIGR